MKIRKNRPPFRPAVRARETERILEEAGLDAVVDEAFRDMVIPDGADLLRDVSDHFKVEPKERWAVRVDTLAHEAARPDEGLRPDQLTTENDG